VLQGYAQQAGDKVVEPDQFRGAVRTFEPQEDFSGVFIVMDADIEDSLAGDSDFLCDVMTTSGERSTRRGLSYIGHAFCNSL
jgi:hypothetical protein